jgi:hypothetical protein
MRMIKRAIRRFADFCLKQQEQHYDLHASSPASQKSLLLQYAAATASFTMDDAAFKVFSQSDEDGRLLYIFSKIGIKNRKCVEIACGNGKECISANLIINHGWEGLLVDGNPANVAEAEAFYETCRATFVWPPVMRQAFITRENVNDLIKKNGFEGEIDLLTIDIDGMDYWVWEAVQAVNPRVVVIECIPWLDDERACTIPYRPDFNAFDYTTTHGAPDYAGATPAALVKLAKRKGYHLVGFNQFMINMFFVRDDLRDETLPEAHLAALKTNTWVRDQARKRRHKVADHEWVDV